MIKKVTAIAILFMFSNIINTKAQKNEEVDSLAGFNMAGALEHAAELKTSTEKNFFFEHAKRTYKIEKYSLLDDHSYGFNKKVKMPIDPLNVPKTNSKTAQGPQPIGCTNIDFEAGDTTSWVVAGDFQITTGGTDPYGGFPKVFPGGTNSLRLNDDNIVGKSKFKASATRIIPVTPINNQFQLHFAFCLLNFPHGAAQAAIFKVQFFDQFNNQLTCPTYSCYYSNPPGTLTGLPPGTAQTSSVTGKNIGNQTYPVTYVPWQTVNMDLTAYNGTNVKVVITCDWCIYNYDWGYCYIDADCGNSVFLPTGALCGGNLCGPPGMLSYTWTPPIGAQSTTSCITASSLGIYTLQCTPYSACTGIKTYTVSAGSTPPNLTYTVTQPSCTNPIASATANVSGASTSVGYTLTWVPTAATVTPISFGSIATGLAVGTNTVKVVDATGCPQYAIFTVNPAPSIASFSISAPSGTLVGCSPATIPLIAVNTGTTSPLSYTWTSVSTGTTTGATINGSAPTGTNTYIVYAQGPGTCLASQTITVGQNNAVPSITVTPTTRTITCNGAPACFTAICSPTVNVQGQWFDASATSLGGLSNSPVLMCTGVPGIYTVVFTNIANGCIASQTVAVSANTTVPTMTVNSLVGNTITCNNPCLFFNITASAGPAPKTYSWTNVTTGITTTPVTGGYTICVPGNYVAQYQDGNFCKISQTITVMIDTLRPTPLSITDLPSNSYTLSCYNTSLTATGFSNPLLSAGNYSWTIPPNLTIATNSIVISTVSVTSNPTTYTVLAKGNNGCVGRQKVNFYKDVLVPPYTAVFTPSAISCSNPSVALSPGACTSSCTIPVTFTFTSPPPTYTANNSGALFGIPGTYTMTYQNTVNGCLAITTTVVPINVVPPATVALAPVAILCGATTTTLTAGTATVLPSYTYTWQPPVGAGAGMSCASCYSTTTNSPGNYFVSITNTVNGCVSTNSVVVTAGSLSVGIVPDPSQGFAPLPVTFANTTILGSAVGAGSITTQWVYGNGLTYSVTNSNTAGSPNGATIYQAAGNYTVMLIVTQSIYSGTTVVGSCVGSASVVISVELPSELIIPNIFTPNGDGSNDFFTIQSTNLTDVTCVIFDRWGVKMYDVTSEKGQVSWDGKNLGGKEVPAGTYFYQLKATGKDDQKFEKQGTVSLYR